MLRTMSKVVIDLDMRGQARAAFSWLSDLDNGSVDTSIHIIWKEHIIGTLLA